MSSTFAPVDDANLDPIFWIFDDYLWALLLIFPSLTCCCIWSLVWWACLRIRLKFYGRNSKSRITGKRHVSGHSNAHIYELYFDFHGKELKDNLNDIEYAYFNENDDIDIVYDPRCPSFNYRVNTDHIQQKSTCHSKVENAFSIFLMMGMIAITFWLQISALHWANFNTDTSEVAVYLLTAIMWPMLVGLVLCLIYKWICQKRPRYDRKHSEMSKLMASNEFEANTLK